MRLDVLVGGRLRTVVVERDAGGDRRFRVAVDGVARCVDVCRLDPVTLSLVFVDDPPSSHEVTINDNGRRGQMAVAVRGAVVEVTVNGGRFAPDVRRAAAGGAGTVRAPMPGRVVRVLVGPGDEVAVRQPLVVIEAMKMENALTAPIAGRVAEVFVQPGEAVETGRILARIEDGGGGAVDGAAGHD